MSASRGDFLDDLGPRRERRRGELVPSPEVEERLPVVPYVPFRCRDCGSTPRTYGQRGRTRYHRCPRCGLVYRSIEVPAAHVDGFR